MASRKEFVEFCMDQMQKAGSITSKRMFGEYGLYCNGKYFGAICEDQVFVKITEAGRRVCPGLTEKPPYEGGNNYFLFEDVEDKERLAELVIATCRELPEPKPKKRKKKEASLEEEGKDQASEKDRTVFDFKKEYKEFYLPPRKPQLVEVPLMQFLAVQGAGDPNKKDGAYQQALGLLYGIAFTLKMSKKSGHTMEGFFDYVVPPLEGLWWQEIPKESEKDFIDSQEGEVRMDYAHKEGFQWISMIRVPEFVTREEFEWAVIEAERKKKTDYSKVEFFEFQEGLCVQCLHVGPYDEEPATVETMKEYIIREGYKFDHSDTRRHHEIYLSDARRCNPQKLRTVIRIPVRKA